MSVTTPLPFLLSPTWSFDGDDGAWSTFAIEVGTPPQSFRILPSTASSEVWVPLPEGCQGTLSGVSDCGTLRGVNNVNDTTSFGFQNNASYTWSQIGIYELAAEQYLFGAGDNGLYGLDTVTLEPLTGDEWRNISSQTVAGFASENYWLGVLGLRTDAGNFSVQSQNLPSLVTTMKDNNLTTSLSFGYLAGASYEEDYGSLILGGYDAARMSSDNLTVPLGGGDNMTLGISLESIVVQNALTGTASLTTGGNLVMTIDSTVSQLWLPQNVCDSFATAFGLTYDSVTDLYLVNSTTHDQLLSLNPTITFTIGPNDTLSTTTTNIVFPYAAFDLNASIPLYNYSTPYFPIRVAANDSQYVLGRAFLQEAYIFVDWERQNLTIAQAVHQNSTSQVVPVLPPSAETTDDEQDTTGLSTGAIAGIAVAAAVVVIALAALAAFFCVRSRRRQRAKKAEQEEWLAEKKESAAELHGEHTPGAEIMSADVHELSEEGKRNEAMGTPITELPGHVIGSELEGDHVLSQDQKDRLANKGKSGMVYELP